jgi:hypothetical protein
MRTTERDDYVIPLHNGLLALDLEQVAQVLADFHQLVCSVRIRDVGCRHIVGHVVVGPGSRWHPGQRVVRSPSGRFGLCALRTHTVEVW